MKASAKFIVIYEDMDEKDQARVRDLVKNGMSFDKAVAKIKDKK